MPGFIGLPELLLLGLVVLLCSARSLPEMGRWLGKGLREFKDSVAGDHGLVDDDSTIPTELTASAG